MSLLRQATDLWKIKMLWHPHGYSWNTLLPGFFGVRLFQRVMSGWKATQKKCTSARPGQNVSIEESTPWPWWAEYATRLKHRGACTIIVVTTIVRFSTEEESLLNCRSIIFTKRSNSFQYPICKRKTMPLLWGTRHFYPPHPSSVPPKQAVVDVYSCLHLSSIKFLCCSYCLESTEKGKLLARIC